MDRYTCRLRNRDGSEDDVELGVCADDGAAYLATRSALLVSLSARAAELWRGDLLIGRLTREVAQFRSRPEPLRAGWRTSAEPT